MTLKSSYILRVSQASALTCTAHSLGKLITSEAIVQFLILL
jgi:hypothetical protein